VGLTGEIRSISRLEKRIHEAYKLGFKTCIVPAENAKSLKKVEGLTVIGVQNVREAIEVIYKR